MLLHGKDAQKLMLKEGCMRIGKKNYAVSKLTERTLPDYPTKDESNFIDNGYVGGKVTLRGRIVNVPKGHEDRVTISIPDPLQTIFDNKIPIERDSLGRFELDIDLANTGVVRMLWAKLILTPGETYFINMDGQTGQTFIMGRDSRLSNELLTHDTPYYKVKNSDFDKKNDAELMKAVEKDYERVKEILNSIMIYLHQNTENSFRLSPSAPDFRTCRGLICAPFCNFALGIRKNKVK